MDKYSSYTELAAAEKEGRDFERIVCRRDRAAAVIIAPHAGSIEPKTGRIAQAIAGAEFSFYCFRGLKQQGNRILHVASRNFDDPACIDLVADHRWVVAIHGCDKAGEQVYLGGLDKPLMHDIASALAEAGIMAEIAGHEYAGTGARNICNLGLAKAGVQIELSPAFRNGARVSSFVAAVRDVLLQRRKAFLRECGLQANT